MRRRFLAAAATVILTLARGAAAQPDAGSPGASAAVRELGEPSPDARPEVESRIEPEDGLSTGDVVTWTLRIRSRSTDDVTVVPASEARGIDEGDTLTQVDLPIHFLDQSALTEATSETNRTQVFSIRFLLLAPGDHALPALAVRVLTEEGELGFVELTSPLVSVGSLLGNEPNAEPKPPTDPISVMEDDPRPLYALGALAAMLVGGILTFLLARWWKRRAERPAPPPPPRPPWVVATEGLTALESSLDEHLERGDGALWADAYSDVLRRYLGARYGFEGLESTTDEVLSNLGSIHLAGVALAEVASLLQETDLIKFAKAPLDGEAAMGLLERGLHVVRATTPLETKAPARLERGGEH